MSSYSNVVEIEDNDADDIDEKAAYRQCKRDRNYCGDDDSDNTPDNEICERTTMKKKISKNQGEYMYNTVVDRH